MVPRSGAYTFFLSSNDGSQLRIDGKVVIDHDGLHYLATKSAIVQLLSGLIAVELTFFHKNGKILEGIRTGATLALEWQVDQHCPRSSPAEDMWSVAPELCEQVSCLDDQFPQMVPANCCCEELRARIKTLETEAKDFFFLQQGQIARLAEQEQAHEQHLQQYSREAFAQVALLVKMTFQGLEAK